MNKQDSVTTDHAIRRAFERLEEIRRVIRSETLEIEFAVEHKLHTRASEAYCRRAQIEVDCLLYNQLLRALGIDPFTGKPQ